MDLAQKKYIPRGDQSRLLITAEGVEHSRENYRTNLSAAVLEAPKKA